MNTFTKFAASGLDLLGSLFLILVAGLMIVAIGLFIFDKTQRKNTIWRNYPVIGHFRNLFQILGEFFRQYFSASIFPPVFFRLGPGGNALQPG